MSDRETTLRHRLHRYLETVEPTTVPGVVGVCLTGSLAAGFVDEYSDIDLTVVLQSDGTDTEPEALAETLLPEAATVQRRVPREKYSFDWNGGHFDVAVVPFTDLRAQQWTLETRWEYDNADVLIDPAGTLEAHLTEEVAFADGERVTLVREYADEFLFTAQWDVHKACLRGSFRAAHRAATRAADNGLALLYLQAGEFVPRDKWIVAGLETIPMVDEEIRMLTWEATRIVERDPNDVHRRISALQSLWERLGPALVEQGFIDSDSLSWDAPPAELCLLE